MAVAKKTNAVHGIVAEFDSVETLLPACRRIRDAGYQKIDAFTPFPVHGIDEALGIKPTVLPWIVLCCGLTGTVTALAMQIFMNTYSYPYVISGKPYLSLPAFMPVAFELTVLFSSFGAFFGMWALNGLPRFSNPVFTDPRFDRATDDRFFLYIDAKDDRFELAGAQRLLGETGSQSIHEVIEDDSPKSIPRFFIIALAIVISLSIVPALIVAQMRVTRSSSPRFHIFPDMDFSPAKDMQQTSSLFADGRAMRPDVPGTVARGQLHQDLDFMTGIDVEELSRIDRPRAIQLARSLAVSVVDDDAGSPKSDQEKPADAPEKKTADPSQPSDVKSEDAPKKTDEPVAEQADNQAPQKTDEPASKGDNPEKEAAAPRAELDPKAKSADAKPVEIPKESSPDATTTGASTPSAAPPVVVDTTPWLKENPLVIDDQTLRLGQQKFDIYCAVCHGVNGSGNGLVNRRAQKILATTWTPPSNLHNEDLYREKYADGKLFSTITNGIRKMPGYGSQIPVDERWAVVAYVRALQKSQNASIDLVPEDRRPDIQRRKSEIEKVLAEQAEKEKQAAAKTATKS
jgi:mono/diheme cytochrome c family protein